MDWTWRQTLAGLGIAFLLGAPALALDAFLRTEREEIIASGHPVPARVVGVASNFFRTNESVVEYTVEGRTHRVEIADTWNSSLEKGSRIELHLRPADPERVATADGFSSLTGRTVPMPLTIYAATAVMISVSSHIKAAYDRRAAPRPVRRPRVRGRRGVVRRNDWLSRMIFGIGVFGLALAPIGVPPAISMAGFCAPIIALGFVLGLMRKVAATPAELIVYDAFTIIWIPRHLISGIMADLDPTGRISIQLRGRSPVKVGVGPANPDPHRYGGGRVPVQMKAVAKFKALLEDVPEEPNAGEPSVKPRWTTIITVATSVAAFILAALKTVQ